MYIGEHRLDCVLEFNFQALDGSGVAVDATGTPSFEIYKANAPMSPAVTGTLSKIDNETGFYGGVITLSAANGFVTGYTYTIRISATIDGVATLTLQTFNLAADVPDIQIQNLVAGGSVSGVISANATELDEEFVPLALEMIDELGKTVEIKIYPAQTYDPTTGEATKGDYTRYVKKIIPPYPYQQKYINGDTIKQGDMQTGIAGSGLGFTPEPGLTEIFIDTQRWTIVNMMPIYSGEQICMFLLQLRR